MKTIGLSGLNVYDPSDVQLLQMVTANAVKWTRCGLGTVYSKRSVSGPHPVVGKLGVVYHVFLGAEITNSRLTELYPIN